MKRRYLKAVTISVAIHAAFVVAALFWLLRGWTGLGTVDVELTHVRLDDIRELPLGPHPGTPPPSKAEPRPRRPPKVKAEPGGVIAAKQPEKPEEKAEEKVEEQPASPPDGGVAPRPSDLRGYAPEGSRLTVLMRLDRLRDTPYAAPVDELLQRMPDRHDLLDGTDLDLYRDFDALLIATPDPMDYTVTLLVTRHHLKEASLREALERGAQATSRTLTWKTVARRPVAERRHNDATGDERDRRLLVLPAPGLAVVTPPVYVKLLTEPKLRQAGATVATADGGVDAGKPSAPAESGWSELVRRIDAEDGALPPEGAVMLTAVDLLSRRPRGMTVQGMTRGAVEDGPQASGLEYIPIPAVLTVVLGPEPTPFLDATGEYKQQEDAERMEKLWPSLVEKVKHNPLLVVAGVSSFAERATLSREGATIKLHLTATQDETLQILQFATRMLRR